MDQDATQWKTLFTRANQLLRATTHPAVVQLPVEGSLPSLDDATEWLNSPPLTTADLRGKVVLVDFWTYTCNRIPGVHADSCGPARGHGQARRACSMCWLAIWSWPGMQCA
jgi:hypothetical protein